jgi:hypothetical protein
MENILSSIRESLINSIQSAIQFIARLLNNPCSRKGKAEPAKAYVRVKADDRFLRR